MSLALRRGTLAAALPALLALAACTDSADPEPEAARMDLVAGGVTVSVLANGEVTGGPLVVERVVGTDAEGDPVVISDSVGLSTFFRRADGSREDLSPEEYQLVVTPASGFLRFIRASAFGGFLEGTATGSTSMTVCVQRRSDESCVFVPQSSVPVEITETAPAATAAPR